MKRTCVICGQSSLTTIEVREALTSESKIKCLDCFIKEAKRENYNPQESFSRAVQFLKKRSK